MIIINKMNTTRYELLKATKSKKQDLVDLNFEKEVTLIPKTFHTRAFYERAVDLMGKHENCEYYFVLDKAKNEIVGGGAPLMCLDPFYIYRGEVSAMYLRSQARG